MRLLITLIFFTCCQFSYAKTVAIIAHNPGTEITDFLVPYYILSESGLADVVAVAQTDGPVQFWPTLQAQFKQTVNSFDASHPNGADIIIVPAVIDPENQALLTWIKQQHDAGALIVSICDGAKVLAHAGLLQNKKAVAHFYSRDELQQNFPDTQWLFDKRYYKDGQVMSTAGVSASVPASLYLVELLSDKNTALQLATRLNLPPHSQQHQQADFSLTWPRKHYGVQLAQGINEMSLAFALDALSRTWGGKVSILNPASASATSKHGMRFFSDHQLSDKTIAKMQKKQRLLSAEDINRGDGFDQALDFISRDFNLRTANFVRTQLEYPKAAVAINK